MKVPRLPHTAAAGEMTWLARDSAVNADSRAPSKNKGSGGYTREDYVAFNPHVCWSCTGAATAAVEYS